MQYMDYQLKTEAFFDELATVHLFKRYDNKPTLLEYETHLENLLDYQNKLQQELSSINQFGLPKSLYLLLKDDLDIEVLPDELPDIDTPESDTAIAAMEDINDRLQKILDWVKETLARIWEGMKDFFNKVVNLFRNMPKYVSGLLEKVIDLDTNEEKFNKESKRVYSVSEYTTYTNAYMYAATTFLTFCNKIRDSARAGKWSDTRGLLASAIFNENDKDAEFPLSVRNALIALGFNFIHQKTGKTKVVRTKAHFPTNKTMKEGKWNQSSIMAAKVIPMLTITNGKLLKEANDAIGDTHKLLLAYAKQHIFKQQNTSPGSLISGYSFNIKILNSIRYLIRELVKFASKLVRMWITIANTYIRDAIPETKEEPEHSHQSGPMKALPATW